MPLMQPGDLALSVEARDPSTQGHSLRVRFLVRRILDALGVPPEDRRSAETAALFHDVGKIGIPDSLLQKRGRLTDEEYMRMKQHVELGAETLRAFPGLEDVAVLIRHHHERFDGSGYPDGLRGEDIPLESRIIAVADTIDAMRSERPYHRPARSWLEIVAELRRVRGSQLDPRIVDVALSLIESPPVPVRRVGVVPAGTRSGSRLTALPISC